MPIILALMLIISAANSISKAHTVKNLPAVEDMSLLSKAYKKQIVCVSLAIYKEARGLPALGQLLVGKTIINRAEDRRKSYCDVIREPHQFPWFKSLPFNWQPAEKQAWRTAFYMALWADFVKTPALRCRVTYFNTVLIATHKKHLTCAITVAHQIYYAMKEH